MTPDHPPLERWTLPNGTVVALGNRAYEGMPVLSVRGKLPDIPDSELREFDLRKNPHFPIKIKNQRNTGSCNGHAAATSLEIARFYAGLAHTDLSPFYIYSILCRGVDRGSIIADALALLKDQGTCPDTLVPHGTINPNRLSDEAKAQAKRFKVEIGFKVESHRDLVVATHLRIPSNFSVPVNSNFDSLDSDGVPQNRAGIHNHAVCGGVGLKKTQKHGWVVLTANSWGDTQWGDRGYFWAAEKTVSGSYSDAYAVSAVEYDPQDQPPIMA